jgi:hypothetical protein
MSEVFNVTLEDDDGRIIAPSNPEHGNAFAVRFLPRKGDEVQINDKHYTVLDVIHLFDEIGVATVSLRLKLKSLDFGKGGSNN